MWSHSLNKEPTGELHSHQNDLWQTGTIYSPVFGAPGSHTKVKRLTAAGNECYIFRIEDAFISMSNSSFNENGLPCLVFIESSAEMDNIRFMKNHPQDSESVIQTTNSTVTLSHSTFHGNGADNGPCIHAKRSILKLSSIEATENGAYRDGGFIFAVNSTLKLSLTKAYNNRASYRGGFIFAVNSNLKLSSTKAYNNRAKVAGGFIFADRSTLSFVKTRAINNQVPYLTIIPDVREEVPSKSRSKTYEIVNGGMGGFVHAIESAISLDQALAINNTAQLGGFIRARNSTVEFARTKAVNNTALSGGLVMTLFSTLDMKGTKAIGNYADRGGFLESFCSRVRLAETQATSNSAKRGGFIHVRDSMLELTGTKASNNTANLGGSVCAEDSTVNDTGSLFSEGEAQVSGGFVSGEQNSSILISNSRMTHGRSKKGGAIALTESDLTAKSLDVVRCDAHSHGGAIMGSTSSTLLCVNCTLRENSAANGNGGAIFFEASADQVLALQLVHSRILLNRATLGGKHPIRGHRAIENFPQGDSSTIAAKRERNASKRAPTVHSLP